MTIRVEYAISKARVVQQISDSSYETTAELRRAFIGVPFSTLKHLQITLDGPHLEHVNRYIAGVRTSDTQIVTWTGDDAVFILNNL
jgi:hypothetical protein